MQNLLELVEVKYLKSYYSKKLFFLFIFLDVSSLAPKKPTILPKLHKTGIFGESRYFFVYGYFQYF